MRFSSIDTACSFSFISVILLFVSSWQHALQSQEMGSAFANEPLDQIASEARRMGDASRGAVVFHYPHLGCVRCHSMDSKSPYSLGPDLTLADANNKLSDPQIVESVLLPSKQIRKGYETHTLVTTDARTLTGRIMESSADRIVIQDAAGIRTELLTTDIEARKLSTSSLMPNGLANQFGSRQSLLDLIAYLIEIRDGGPDRARELQPPPSMLVFSLPDYESHIDHAQLARETEPGILKQGEAIYQRVCGNCHGTLEQPGSLPTSLRFAEGKFKNGSDPYSMYQTLTRGFGMMTPQAWMVPKQKYAVIHYIRESFLRTHNRSQWHEVTETYLNSLPLGDTLGPEPSKIEPWSSMDYGPTLTHTFEVPGGPLNLAYKGVAVRLDLGAGGIARGNQWMLFDTDTLRWAAGWQATDSPNRFIDWRGIQFNGQHQVHPKLAGQVVFANANGPGWANPVDGSFRDVSRVIGRDNRRYGPLPKAWASYRGQYRHGHSVIVEYRVGSASVFEMPGLLPNSEQQHGPVFLRHLWIGPRSEALTLRVADLHSTSTPICCGISDTAKDAVWKREDQQLWLQIPAGPHPMRFTIGIAQEQRVDHSQSETRFSLDLDLSQAPDHGEINSWIHGSKAMWLQELQTQIKTVDEENNPFVVDFLTSPESNPWLAQIRLTGLDFLSDGRIAVCTWDGDVWIVTQLPASGSNKASKLSWKRIASGLFQPLGIKAVDDVLYVTCRDQIATLHDLNSDGEIDHYACFNNDHQVTEHFHEFAMGLQRDSDGNFYYAKSARHALPSLVPHHGTLLQVSPDGSSTTIIANGFRAANGVCINDDGSFFVTDQEGHWTPKNRINWVRRGNDGRPRFYGNMFGYSDKVDTSNEAMEQPLCWITNAFDRSPGELLWIDSKKWGPLDGSLLNLSYGTGKVFLVPHEKLGGTIQGGMIELPIPTFPTGVMRGRFSPHDQQLYVGGMYAWAGSAQHPGGFYRIRATGQDMHLPVGLRCRPSQIELEFTSPIQATSLKADSFYVKTWSLKRSANYGSKHFDERDLSVEHIQASNDGKTIVLQIPDLQPTWCMEIQYRIQTLDGKEIQGTVNNTIHKLTQ